MVHTSGDLYKVFDCDALPPTIVRDKHSYPDMMAMGKFEYIYHLLQQKTQNAVGRHYSFIAIEFGNEYFTLGNFMVQFC